jgi:S1-C subfamily serine protease
MVMRFLNATLMAATLAAPLAGQARDTTTRMRTRRPVRVWVDSQEVTPRFEMLIQRRARLGVVVGLEPKETDSIGAFIQSVTPGGPAAKAGIRSGDLITRLNGESLLPAPGRKVSSEESYPGAALIEIAAKLEPNDTIAVEYVRGEARRTASLVTGDEPVLAMGEGGRGFTFSTPEGRVREFRMPELRFEGQPGWDFRWDQETPGQGPAIAALMLGSGALRDLELAPLNPDLGAYFGATEGVLVIRAPADSPLGLKGGDVVLGIDGRKPSSPSSLMRILRSYDDGEAFRLDVLRMKKRETVTGKMERGREDEEQ